MTKSVAILGCGPAGLLVAHAAAINGWNFRIYSKKRKSMLFGAQYLHEAIPGMSDEQDFARVHYHLEGTPEEYRKKIYGPSWDGTVSPEDLDQDHYAWDIRSCYDRLWDAYCDEIVDTEITPHWAASMNSSPYWTGGPHPDQVVSTVPRKIWAEPGDVFASTKVWAYGDAPEWGQRAPFRPDSFTVICDGTDSVGWYRASNIFDHCTIEWPEYRKPPIRAQIVEKPLYTDSTAASDFHHLGRYGAWRKGILTTDAFHDAMHIFKEDAIDARQ